MPSFRGILPIFRGPFLERIAQGKHHSVLREILTNLPSKISFPSEAPLKKWYNVLYRLLLKNYQCEYVYKNAIAHQLYLKYHNPEEALLTDEFDVGQSRADVVVINDTSTVYEIKTEFDSLDRLESQFLDYSRVFDKIFLVTTEKRYKEVLPKLYEPIGIYIMEDGNLHLVREASSNVVNTDPATIFCCMRKPEYLSAINEAFGYVPDVPNGLIWRSSFNLFKGLSSEEAHSLMVDHVVTRSSRKPFTKHIREVPDPLGYACLAINRPRWIPKIFVSSVMESLEEPVLQY